MPSAASTQATGVKPLQLSVAGAGCTSARTGKRAWPAGILLALDANAGANDLQDACRIEAELIVLVLFLLFNNMLDKMFFQPPGVHNFVWQIVAIFWTRRIGFLPLQSHYILKRDPDWMLTPIDELENAGPFFKQKRNRFGVGCAEPRIYSSSCFIHVGQIQLFTKGRSRLPQPRYFTKNFQLFYRMP